MLFLLLCNRRTLLQLKENIEWENCAGLDLWCQHSFPGYNSDSDSRHPFKSHSMKDAGWCWHSSVSPIIVVLRIVNIATSGGPGFVNCIRLYQDSDLRDDNCWQPGHFIQAGSSWQSRDIYEDETWGAVTMSGSSTVTTVTMILSRDANTRTFIPPIISWIRFEFE